MGAKKLDDNGKCTNPKCPKCIQEKIISNLKNKEGVDSPETAKEIYERKMEKDGRTKN